MSPRIWFVQFCRRLPGSRRDWIALAVVVLLGNFFAWWYGAQESFIPTWDSATYLRRHLAFCDDVRESPVHAAGHVYRSVRHDEYNLLICVGLVPFGLIGPSRELYICGVVTLYLAPVVVLFAGLVDKLAGGLSHRRYGLVVAGLFLFVPIWGVLLRGMPDMAGLIFVGLALYLFSKQPLEKMPLREACQLGVLVLFAFLTRRWYAYWGASFLISVGVVELARVMLTSDDRWGDARRIVTRLACAGGVAAGLLVVFALRLVKTTLGTNYAEIYSAWQNGQTFAERFVQGMRLGGDLALLLALLGLGVYAWCVPAGRRVATVLAASTVLGMALFSRVQAAGFHQFLIVTPALMLGVGLLLVYLPELLGRTAGRIAAGACLALLAVQFTYGFGVAPTHSAWLEAARAPKYPPLVRSDRAELERMVRVLNDLAGATPGRKPRSVYVLSSSYQFNIDHLRVPSLLDAAAEAPKFKFLWVPEVDKRDGLPLQILEADFVVATDPFQIHLQPEDQQSIIVPTAQLSTSQGLGVHFQRLPHRFALDGGVTAFLYQRRAPIALGDRQAFETLMKTAFRR